MDPSIPEGGFVSDQGVVRGTNFAQVPTSDPHSAGSGSPTTTPLDYFTPPMEYGNAPESAEGGYQTTLGRDGARHLIVSGSPFFGTHPPDADLMGVGDEQGVLEITAAGGSGLPLPGNPIDLALNVQGAGFLSLWVDWNRDGDWDDAGEAVVVDQQFDESGQLRWRNLLLSPGAVAGPTFVRARVSSVPGLGPRGLAPDGQVVDVRIQVGQAQHRYFTNPYHRMDVNNDGHVGPRDVLAVLNAIHAQGVEGGSSPQTHFVDINQDGLLTAVDLLIVINFLNAGLPPVAALHAPFAVQPAFELLPASSADRVAEGEPPSPEPAALAGVLRESPAASVTDPAGRASSTSGSKPAPTGLAAELDDDLLEEIALGIAATRELCFDS